MPPTVSIVVPNKNRCDELAETLASVRAQAFGDFECLVVDDNSTDQFDARVAPFLLDRRFQVIRQPDGRSGAPAARNDGFGRSRGRYVLFLDSDDLIAPHCLQHRVAVMESRPELDFAIFPAEMFRVRPGDVGLLWNADTGEDDLDRFCRHDVPWQTTGPIWRREALEKVGPWDEAALSAQDWEFHIRAVAAGLRYDRVSHGRVDLFWRMAAADRSSIGKSSVIERAYHPARLALWRRMYARLRDGGLMTDLRRRCFVGMYYTACEQMGMKHNRRAARAAWSAALEDGLVGRWQWLQGWLLLVQLRWPLRYERAKAARRAKWPPEYFLPRSATFMKTPVDPSSPGRGDSRPRIAEVA